MKIRQDRYDHREHLKWEANRQGHRAAEHPQSRRQMDEGDDQIEEALSEQEEETENARLAQLV